MKDGSKTKEAVLTAIKRGAKTVKDAASKADVGEGTARKYIGELLAAKQVKQTVGGAKVEGEKGRPADNYEIA